MTSDETLRGDGHGDVPDDGQDGRTVAAGEDSDAQPMAEPGHEGLLTGPLGGGAWTAAWSVPVGLAWQEVVANNQQGGVGDDAGDWDTAGAASESSDEAPTG